jgi:molybdate transport system ATP-binding protein
VDTLRARVKMVNQNPFHQLLYATVNANVQSAYKRNKRAAVFSMEDGVRMLGLEPLLSREVGTLSFGEAQRVAFLCAVLQGPELLIVDESFAALDSAGIMELSGMLELFKGHGISSILVSQIEAAIARVSDAMLYMR